MHGGRQGSAPDQIDNSFGRHVKRLRKVRGLTQEQLAERSDLAPDTIRRLEHTEFSPSLMTLRKLCAGLGLSVSALFVGFEMPEPDPAFNDLVALLRGCSENMLRLVTRIVKDLLHHLDRTAPAGEADDA